MVAVDEKLIRRRKQAIARFLTAPCVRSYSSLWPRLNFASSTLRGETHTSGTTQTRTTNSQNQIASITGTAGAPQYDPNGNMTTDQNGNKLVYDAWNRLISVTNSSGQVLAQYTYNALSQRVTETYPIAAPGIPANTVKNPGAAAQPRHPASAGFRGIDKSPAQSAAGAAPLNLYYGTGGQILEERWDGTAASNTQYQYVWSAIYVNAVVLRDTFTAGTIQPDMRIYTTNDANYNVTSLVTYNVATQTWGVSERFVYSPYGSVLVFDASFTSIPDAFNWQYMYQGGRFDTATGLYHFGARNYSPSLGVWISQDPLQYVNGANTYQMEMSGPVGAVDPGGLVITAGTTAAQITNSIDNQFYSEYAVGTAYLDALSFEQSQQGADLAAESTLVGIWYHQGFRFAAALLDAFISKSFPSGHAGEAFQAYAPEIKASPEYRKAAQAYFGAMAKKLGPGTWPIMSTYPKTPINTKYYDEGYGDLFFALGGAHFGIFQPGFLIVDSQCKWHTLGLMMFQRDNYTFPNAPITIANRTVGHRNNVLAYRYANQLQFNFGYRAFSHHEVWADSFRGGSGGGIMSLFNVLL